MVDSFPPRRSGIYLIRCIPNSKIYVGSAADIRLRWRRHVKHLRRGDHQNSYLQKAWLDGSGCTIRSLGFNLKRLASSAGQCMPKRWPGFKDPAGSRVTIVNLHAFCRENGLNFNAMRSLAIGRSKLKSHKGWTHERSVRQRPYIKTHVGFIDPEGRPAEPIVNLAAFCRERGLDATHMVAVAQGRICSHRGWTHQNGRARTNIKTYTGFIAPDGRHIAIVNLSAFCRANGLSIVHMHNVKSGQRRIHRGWTWRQS